RRLGLLYPLLMFCLSACSNEAAPVAGPAQPQAAAATTAAATTAGAPGPRTPFPDFGYLPPPSKYKGDVFKLTQDSPAAAPPASAVPPVMKADFQKDWKNYMLQVRSYCFEGNVENDWRVENNTVRKWYHIPWQHYGPNGREGIHGLTKEAPVQVKQLAPT